MTSRLLDELLRRNSKVVENYQAPPHLIPLAEAARPTGAATIILSCSDPRLNPYAIFGIDPTIQGVSMVRNAGGRAMDAIRSISVLQTIAGAKTVVVLHHTGEQYKSNCTIFEQSDVITDSEYSRLRNDTLS